MNARRWASFTARWSGTAERGIGSIANVASFVPTAGRMEVTIGRRGGLFATPLRGFSSEPCLSFPLGWTRGLKSVPPKPIHITQGATRVPTSSSTAPRPRSRAIATAEKASAIKNKGTYARNVQCDQYMTKRPRPRQTQPGITPRHFCSAVKFIGRNIGTFFHRVESSAVKRPDRPLSGTHEIRGN